MKKNSFYAAVIAAVIFMLLNSGAVIRYSREALYMCFETVIPSLFPFFVMSGLLIYSGFGSVLSRAAGHIMRPLFNVAPAGAAAFVTGMISGFPLGAVTAAELYKSGSLSRSEAERLLAFSGNSSPLFMIGTVGASIYCSTALGLLLYLIHILASFLVGMIFSRTGRGRHSSPPMRLITRELPLTEVFSSALTRAAQSIITVCFAIVFFSSLSRAFLDLLPLPPVLHAAAAGLCEFSTGVLAVSALSTDTAQKLIMISFIIGFSGLCVHLQVIASIADTGLSLVPYITGKLLHGAIAAALTLAALRLLPIEVPAFAPAAPMSAAFCISPLLLLIPAPILFLLRRHAARS